jgi:DNA-binding NtrC family response regulator
MMLTVLVIAQDATLLNGLRDVIEIEGHRALTADTLESAPKLAAEFPPDVILYHAGAADPRGHELVQGLRAQRLLALVPVVIVGHDESAAEQADIVREFLRMPFDAAELLKSLVDVAAAAKAEREAEQRAVLAAGIPGQTRVVTIVPARLRSPRAWLKLSVYIVRLQRTPTGAHDDDGLSAPSAFTSITAAVDGALLNDMSVVTVEANVDGLEIMPASANLYAGGEVGCVGFAVRLKQPFYGNSVRGSVVGRVGTDVVFDVPVEIPLRLRAESLSPRVGATHTLPAGWQQAADFAGGALLHPHRVDTAPTLRRDGTKHSVLVVDDEVGALTLIGIMLERGGYVVFKARDRDGALAVVEEYLPDLILVDSRMADLSAFSLIRWVRGHKATQDTPIVVMCATDDKEGAIHAVEAGANAVLYKPILHTDLIAKVRQMLPNPTPSSHQQVPPVDTPAKSQVSPPTADPPGAALSVLVLHHDAARRAALVKVLQRSEYSVNEADSLESARAQLELQVFDAVLLDMRLSSGDPIAHIPQLKVHNPDMSVVLLTGYNGLRQAIDALSRGATDYLIEPSSADDIRQVVHTALNRVQKLRQRRMLLSNVQQHDALMAELAVVEAAEACERTLAACRMLARFGARGGVDIPIIIAAPAVEGDLRQRAREAGAAACISLNDVSGAAHTVAACAGVNPSRERVRIIVVSQAVDAAVQYNWLKHRGYSIKRVESHVDALRALSRKPPALFILTVETPRAAAG